MKLYFLGTGTSTGVPEIACTCEVCSSRDPRDNRLRASIWIETEGKSILIDCGPDFRYQAIRAGIKQIDAVLITHEHYDHVGGVDDLRPFCTLDKSLRLYAEKHVVDTMQARIPYAFSENKYPGVPNLEMQEVCDCPFSIGDVQVVPIRLMHGRLPIFGYRIGKVAYLTDLKTIPESEFEKLQGLDVLIINALRDTEHISHQTLSDALKHISIIQPRQAYLIHMSHHFGLHAQMEKEMPQGVQIAYDGLELSIFS